MKEDVKGVYINEEPKWRDRKISRDPRDQVLMLKNASNRFKTSQYPASHP